MRDAKTVMIGMGTLAAVVIWAVSYHRRMNHESKGDYMKFEGTGRQDVSDKR